MRHIKFIPFLFLVFLIKVTSAQTSSTDYELKWDKGQQPFQHGYIDDLKIIDTNNEFIYYDLKTVKYAAIGSGEYYYRFLVQQKRISGEYNFIDIQPQFLNNKLSYLASETINNVFHVISYFNNKSQNKLIIFDQTFDQRKLLSNNDIHKIAEIDLKSKGELLEYSDMFNNHGELHFVFNNGRFLLSYNCRTTIGTKYYFEVFARNLQYEWGAECKIIKDKDYNVEKNYTIDNDGNVYAIQEREKYITQKFLVEFYPKDGSKIISLPLELENNGYFSAKQISVNKENNLICAGLYTSEKSDIASGAFSYIIEPKLAKVKVIHMQEFSQDLIKKGYEFKQKNEVIKKQMLKKDFDKKFNYNLNDIYFRQDGGFDVVAERYFSETHVSGYSGNTHTSYEFRFDDLWVLNFNPDATFKWIQKIPKYEYVFDKFDILGGYFLYHDKNENLNFIYNNIHSKNAINPRSRNISITVTTKLDKDGNETFKELINDKDISKIIVPKYIFKENNDGIILTQYNPLNFILNEKKYNNLIFGELIYK